jgi:hypothetical protein
MSFEERLLMELKSEIVSRQVSRRRTIGRRLFAGAAAAGLAAAAAVAVPLLTGTESPAYALTKNSDGTVVVQIKEFRDADKLESDLKKMGVPADVTYVEPGKRCKAPRGEILGGSDGSLESFEKSPSYLAAPPPRDGRLTLHPRHIGQGQTLVMEFTERKEELADTDSSQVLWRFAGWVIQGEIKPCELLPDPRWNNPLGEKGMPPKGS